MSVHVENIGGGGSGSGFPPKLDPSFTAPQVPVLVKTWRNQTDIGSNWRMDYIGSDSLNMGLLFDINEQYVSLQFTPSGQNPPPQGYFQSGVVLTPLQLAWYTGMRYNQQSVIDLITGIDLNQPGVATIACLACLTGGCKSGQCYALVAATEGDPPRQDLALRIQHWSFPNVPNIGTAQPPHTRWVPTTLLECGRIQDGQRIFLQAIDRGTYWTLIAYVDYNEFRGRVNDSRIGAGQPALSVINFAGTSPILCREYVGGWGPNDAPFGGL